MKVDVDNNTIVKDHDSGIIIKEERRISSCRAKWLQEQSDLVYYSTVNITNQSVDKLIAANVTFSYNVVLGNKRFHSLLIVLEDEHIELNTLPQFKTIRQSGVHQFYEFYVPFIDGELYEISINLKSNNGSIKSLSIIGGNVL